MIRYESKFPLKIKEYVLFIRSILKVLVKLLIFIGFNFFDKA